MKSPERVTLSFGRFCLEFSVADLAGIANHALASSRTLNVFDAQGLKGYGIQWFELTPDRVEVLSPDGLIVEAIRLHDDCFQPKIAKIIAASCKPRFSFGRTVVTTQARALLSLNDIKGALARHLQGDWGEIHPDDRKQNDEALIEGKSLYSVYRNAAGSRFWVITDWDRSVTTVLTPGDFL